MKMGGLEYDDDQLLGGLDSEKFGRIIVTL
jgi:hypothetical protein